MTLALFGNASEPCCDGYLQNKKAGSSRHSTPVRHLLDLL